MRKSLSLALAGLLILNASYAYSRRAPAKRPYEEQENAILIALVRYQISQSDQGAICVKDTLDAPPPDLRRKLFFWSSVKINPNRDLALAEYHRDLSRLGKNLRAVSEDARLVDRASLAAAGFEIAPASLEQCAPLTVISMARGIIHRDMGFFVGDWANACFSSAYHATAIKEGKWRVKYYGNYYPHGGSPVCSPSGEGRLIGVNGERYLLARIVK